MFCPSRIGGLIFGIIFVGDGRVFTSSFWGPWIGFFVRVILFFVMIRTVFGGEMHSNVGTARLS